MIAYTEQEAIEFKKKKQAYVMLAANYNNLGNIAITKAQESFLKKILPDDYEVIVVPHNKTYMAHDIGLYYKHAMYYNGIII